jgi:ferritin-like metal-binding protein YciE
MHAEILGDNRAVRLLDETLFEEQEADERLNDLAMSLINEEAADGSNSTGGRGAPKTRAAGDSSRDEP